MSRVQLLHETQYKLSCKMESYCAVFYFKLMSLTVKLNTLHNLR
jgi:hypothetical protein